MGNESQDAGVLAVIVERMEEQRLPRALDLKEKVDQGELLDDMDIDVLEQVFADTNALRPLLARNPEYHGLAAQMMSLYREITTKALENEQKGGQK